MTAPTNVVLRHGYTLDDLDRIAKTVVVVNMHWWPAGDRRDQIDTAWSAVAEALYAADDEPSERDLHAAGTAALVADTKAYRKHHGVLDGGLVGATPRMAAYWYEPPADHWADRAVERIAARQILNTLTATDLEAVTALAATGDYAAAAEALGLRYTALTARLAVARRRFRRAWFAPEAPPAIRGTDRRVGSRSRPPRTHCAAGHELTAENTRVQRRSGRADERMCRRCEHERAQRRAAA